MLLLPPLLPLLLLLLPLPPPALGQQTVHLRVGTVEAPPFLLVAGEGDYRGFIPDLLQDIAGTQVSGRGQLGRWCSLYEGCRKFWGFYCSFFFTN